MERDRYEILTLASALGIGLSAVFLSQFAFTKKQREAILERDGNKCQFPAKHKHKGGLQVHHIIPQRYAQEVGIEDPDFAENGISLCEDSHVGPNGVHPDIFQAKKKYPTNPKAYVEVFSQRKEKLKKKEIYWDETWDRQMHVVAIRNTQKATKEGWIFPEKKKKS